MTCPQCNTEIEQGFDACWKCGRNSSDESAAEQREEVPPDNGLPCLRCGTMLDFAGNFRFHEGTRGAFSAGSSNF